MHIQSFTFNPFQENTYVLYDDASHAVLIDPGFADEQEQALLFDFIAQHQLQVGNILLTHAHIDHILGLDTAVKQWGCVPIVHEDEKQIFASGASSASLFQLPYTPYAGDIHFVDKQTTNIDTVVGKLAVLHAPGHSPGSICFYVEEAKSIIAGDVLFLQSIGRTDLPGGDFDTLIHSIKHQLFTLPHETKVFAGHGEPTYIGYEKEYNPFLKEANR